MNIQLYTFNPNSTNNKALPINKFKTGEPNFCAMKKSNFEGFDLVCVNRFKAPIEKFNSLENFHTWAKSKLMEKLKTQQYATNDYVITAERNDILQTWNAFLIKDKDFKNKPSLALIIADGITHNLDKINKDIPLILYPKALTESIELIKQNLSETKGYSFNFGKIYAENLRKIVTKDIEILTDTTQTKWVKIPSADSDDENFDLNVEKLKILSHRTWCTKFIHARPYLSAGDMYIYLKKGQPQICIRMINDSIDEIQGKKNNGIVPLDEIDNVVNFINKEGLDYRLIQKNIKDAKEAKKEFIRIKKELKPLIKENDKKGILALFNIRTNFDKNGKLTISHFEQPSKFFTYKELGLNEESLFEGLQRIERNADFAHSSFKILKDLEEIGQDAFFNHSLITRLPKLKSIGGIAKFSDSKLKEAPELKSIGSNTWMNNCEDIKFDSLETIDGTLFITDSKIKILPKLRTVSEELLTRGSQTLFPSLNK